MPSHNTYTWMKIASHVPFLHSKLISLHSFQTYPSFVFFLYLNFENTSSTTPSNTQFPPLQVHNDTRGGLRVEGQLLPFRTTWRTALPLCSVPPRSRGIYPSRYVVHITQILAPLFQIHLLGLFCHLLSTYLTHLY